MTVLGGAVFCLNLSQYQPANYQQVSTCRFRGFIIERMALKVKLCTVVYSAPVPLAGEEGKAELFKTQRM